MSQLSIRQRLCQVMYRNELVSLVGAALLGLVGVGLLAQRVRAGEPLTDQVWFVAFLVAYVVGVRPLVASVRE